MASLDGTGGAGEQRAIEVEEGGTGHAGRVLPARATVSRPTTG